MSLKSVSQAESMEAASSREEEAGSRDQSVTPLAACRASGYDWLHYPSASHSLVWTNQSSQSRGAAKPTDPGGLSYRRAEGVTSVAKNPLRQGCLRTLDDGEGLSLSPWPRLQTRPDARLHRSTTPPAPSVIRLHSMHNVEVSRPVVGIWEFVLCRRRPGS